MSAAEGTTVRTTVTREERFRFRVRFDLPGVADLLTDEPPPLGEGRGPNPARLLAAAVGNCLAASLLFCLEKARVPVRGIEASVELTLERNEQGRLRVGRVAVRLAPDVAARARDRLPRCLDLFESFCVVTESVRRGIPVDVAVEPPPAEPAAPAPGGSPAGRPVPAAPVPGGCPARRGGGGAAARRGARHDEQRDPGARPGRREPPGREGRRRRATHTQRREPPAWPGARAGERSSARRSGEGER